MFKSGGYGGYNKHFIKLILYCNQFVTSSVISYSVIVTTCNQFINYFTNRSGYTLNHSDKIIYVSTQNLPCNHCHPHRDPRSIVTSVTSVTKKNIIPGGL